QERGVSAETADEIFQLIVMFAGYGFNKSHSAAYAKLGYQTAFLKTHYTAEFMAALLSSEIDDSNKRDIMVEHIDDAKRLGDKVSHGRRAALLEALGRAMQSANLAQEDRRHGQRSLFEVMEGAAAEPNGNGSANGKEPIEGLRAIPEWSPSERLKQEKEALDFYISSHPLAQHADTLRTFASYTTADLKELSHQQEVFLGGMFTQVRLMNTKKARNGNS